VETDGQTDGGDCITCRADAVGNKGLNSESTQHAASPAACGSTRQPTSYTITRRCNYTYVS